LSSAIETEIKATETRYSQPVGTNCNQKSNFNQLSKTVEATAKAVKALAESVLQTSNTTVHQVCTDQPFEDLEEPEFEIHF
jgi:hypothetical protein